MENEMIVCECCGEDSVVSQMKPYYLPNGQDDFDTVYYCQTCFNRIMENAERES